MKKIFVATFTFISLAGAGTTSAADAPVAVHPTPQSPTITSNNAMDATKFCYADGKAYSEGWKIGEVACTRKESIVTNFNADDKAIMEPLYWADGSKKKVR